MASVALIIPDMNSLNRSGAMRTFLVFVMMLGLIGCKERQSSSVDAPSAPASSADYGQARASFKTKLVRRLPAPEPASAVHYSKLVVPNGVKMVRYRPATCSLERGRKFCRT